MAVTYFDMTRKLVRLQPVLVAPVVKHTQTGRDENTGSSRAAVPRGQARLVGHRLDHSSLRASRRALAPRWTHYLCEHQIVEVERLSELAPSRALESEVIAAD
jgi:hypothetical protein